MTDTEKLKLLLGVLKEVAETPHWYNREHNNYSPSRDSYDTAFDDGAEWGEITFARTLLEQIGVEFEYPVMEKQ